MRKDWPQVRIDDVQIGNKDRQRVPVGESLQVSAKVHLGGVDPKHVRVEAYHGEAENDTLRHPTVTPLGKVSVWIARAITFTKVLSRRRKVAPMDLAFGLFRHIRIYSRRMSFASLPGTSSACSR